MKKRRNVREITLPRAFLKKVLFGISFLKSKVRSEAGGTLPRLVKWREMSPVFPTVILI